MICFFFHQNIAIWALAQCGSVSIDAAMDLLRQYRSSSLRRKHLTAIREDEGMYKSPMDGEMQASAALAQGPVVSAINKYDTNTTPSSALLSYTRRISSPYPNRESPSAYTDVLHIDAACQTTTDEEQSPTRCSPNQFSPQCSPPPDLGVRPDVHVSPLPDVQPKTYSPFSCIFTPETINSYSLPPEAFKLCMEQRIEFVMKSVHQRHQNRMKLEAVMSKCQLDDATCEQMRRFLAQKGSNFLRMCRAKLYRDIFDVIVKPLEVCPFEVMELVQMGNCQLYNMKTLRKADVRHQNQVDTLPEAVLCLSELSENDTMMLSSDNEDTCADNSSVTSSSKQCCLQVRLCSMNTNSSKEKMIYLQNYPSRGKNIKLAIEKQLGIPACVQVLSFNSQVISDDTSPSRMRMREGDTVVVSYSSEANISHLSELIATLKKILSLVRTVTASLRIFRFIGESIHVRLSQECDSFNADNVPQTYFSRLLTGSPNSHHLYFIDKGGLKLLLQIYSTLHQLPWHELPYEMQQLEYSCLKILLDFSATLGIRYLILQRNIIDQVFKSLMRTKIRRYYYFALPGKLLDHYVSIRQSRYTLAETLHAAVAVIGKYVYNLVGISS